MAKIDVVGGRYTGAKVRLDRDGDTWQLRGDIGGCTLTGPLRLQTQRGEGWRFTGDGRIAEITAHAEGQQNQARNTEPDGPAVVFDVGANMRPDGRRPLRGQILPQVARRRRQRLRDPGPRPPDRPDRRLHNLR